MLPKEQSLEVNVRHEASVTIIDLHGEINAFSDGDLQDAYRKASEQNPSAILLNFSAVDYINSTGIALIVGLLAKARKDRRPVLTFGLSAHYQEIFQITRLSDFMSIFPDEKSALAEATA